MEMTDMSNDVTERYELAHTLILDAGAVAEEFFGRLAELTVNSKGVQDVVTEADVAVEVMIKERLAAAFPQDAFVGEETGSNVAAGSSGIWVVDPIDGTQPFISGMTNWCISMAYVQDGVLEFGLVYNPPLGELFVGGLSVPAMLNGRPIAVHPGQALTDGITSVGYSPRIGADDIIPVMDRLLRRGGTFFRSGSGALALCYVACGRLLGYVEPQINSWDCLGAVAIIRAAGGITNDYLTGNALLEGNHLVAGPPAVFAALTDVLGL